MDKKNNSQKKKNKVALRYSIKILLIIVVLSFFVINTGEEPFSNTIPLLAVNQDNEGEIRGGGVIDLELEITPGTGRIFVNSNSLKEIDTQLSITNGKETACSIFELKCDKYDFYYTFKGVSSILKGPSATSSIALITAKTLNHKKLNGEVAMTGSLNSVGVIGPVGGIDEKIKIAEEEGFEKVIIPQLSTNNVTNNTNIEVIQALDIIEAYNSISDEEFNMTQSKKLNTNSYDKLMSSLVEDMCGITNTLNEKINKTNYTNSTKNQILNEAKQNMNSSKIAKETNSYYSAASFCFGANNNLEILNQLQNNLDKNQTIKRIQNLSKNITQKQEKLNSQEYIGKNIHTKNDLYVYLILQDRTNEASQYLGPYLNNNTNTSMYELKSQYSYAKQRLNSVDLWETFLVHQGERIQFNQDLINNACNRITQNINSKAQVLSQYDIEVFDNLIEEQNEIQEENKYNCIYNGLEIDGRINTAFFSYNIEQSQKVTNKLFDLTNAKIAKDGSKNFPLMPFIYHQYSQELYNQGDFQSSLLYINYAQSFANIDFYLQQPQEVDRIIQEAQNEIFTNPVLIFALLLLIGFI